MFYKLNPRRWSNRRRVGALLVVVALAFFLNPWALAANLQFLNYPETPSFWEYLYGTVPQILHRHPDLFPEIPDFEKGIVCREHLESLAIGSLVISRCPDNGNIAADWAWDIVDVSHIGTVVDYYWEKAPWTQAYMQKQFDACIADHWCKLNVDEAIARLTKFEFSTHATSGYAGAPGCDEIQYARTPGTDKVAAICRGRASFVKEFGVHALPPNQPIPPLLW